MGYKTRSAFVITFMTSMVFLLILIVDTFFLQGGMGLVIGVTLGWIGLQYLISPIIIGWIFRIEWLNEQQLSAQFPHLHEIIQKAAKQDQIAKLPRFGVIRDGNPNAFTYGWSKNSARLIITTGIIELLDENEQRAVVAHELGHIVHQDFIVMTFINAIPVLFYTIYRLLLNLNRYSSSKGKSRVSSSGKSGDYMQYIMYARYILVVFSYVMYIIGTFISLLLSRWREYWADQYSAELTQDPDLLSTSLVKIAYGILQEPPKKGERKSRAQYVRALGIFDKRSAKALAFSSTNAKKELDMNIFAKAAAWDLYQPWAKYFEVFSTHPLPAKRIRALNKMNETKFGNTPSIDLAPAKLEFKKQMGNTAIDEFIGELFIQILPNLVFWGWFILGGFLWLFNYNFSGVFLLPISNPISFFMIGFVLLGFFMIVRTMFKYRMNFEAHSILDLVGTINVSPIRSVPTVTQGTVIGKGVPGLFYSEDLVIRDDVGLIYIDYNYGIGLINTLFGIFKADQLRGKPVEITGWYRRGPSPYIQVHRIALLDGSGKIIRNHKRGMQYFGAILIMGLGLLFWVITNAAF